MVSKLLGTVQKKYTTVSEAAVIIALFTLLAQFLGVVRDRLFAYYLGPGKELDIYLTAFRIPDFLYVILSTLISATVLIPLLSQTKGDTEKHRNDVNILFTVFFSLTGVLALVLFISMPFIASLIAPGFNPESTTRLIFLSRIMLVSPMLLAISNFIGSINQFHKKFFAYAMAPVFYNIGIIFGIAILYKKFGLFGLGLGVILGAMFHLVVQMSGYVFSTKVLSFTKITNFSIIKKVLKLSIPRTFTLALFNLLLIVIISIASHFEPGSISLLTFAFNIGLVPLSLVGNSFATAAFPYLISFALNDKENFNILVDKTIGKVIFWTVALSAVFIVFRAHIVRIILGTNLFSWNDTKITAALVFIILISVVFQSITHFFIRVYYAEGKTKKPFYLVFCGFILTTVLLLLSQFISSSEFTLFIQRILRISDTYNNSIVVLSMAYTIGTFITMLLFIFSYQIESKRPIVKFISKEIIFAFLHACMLVFLLKVTLLIFESVIYTKTLIGILLQAGLTFFIAIIIWFFYLFLIKNNHVLPMRDRLKRFLGSHKILLEEPQDL